MSSQQTIKRRIGSVGNTRQITKAMQLVAASKLRRAQEEALGAKDYIDAARSVLERLAVTQDAAEHPFFQVRDNVRSVLTIVITSDRGLAGAYNANVLRAYTRMCLQDDVIFHKAFCVGKYGSELIARIKEVEIIGSYLNHDIDVNVEVAQPLFREAAHLFTSGQVDEVRVVYTKYVSTVKQHVVTDRLLPITPPDVSEDVLPRYLEPTAKELLGYTAEHMLEALVLQSVLESQASEHANRMLAMKNATDNATELIDDLTLAANKARQATITQELAEISAGAEAMK